MSEAILLEKEKKFEEVEDAIKGFSRNDSNENATSHPFKTGECTISNPASPVEGMPFAPPLETCQTFASMPSKEQNTTLRKPKLFGLNRRSVQDMQPQAEPTSNRFDYEQKYPPDRFGEELAPNARVWLTYLDEAEAYDRDKVEGWKDTVDVLLVFTGLFSAIVSAFVVQSSQSLQQDFTQVSASLLFEMVQLQRAQLNGIPIINVPNSTLTPNSPFSPSDNAFLVNVLWFISLVISLSTALFAVLAKQWIYYYMTLVSGTARDKVRVRHFKFQGLEKWKVGFIIDLLPVFVHLALGVFLIGLILLVLPLDIRIARAVIILSGITFVSYFISVALPIWRAECPYTTSLTIYMRNVLYFGFPIFRVIGLFTSLPMLLYHQRVFLAIYHPFQVFFHLIGRTTRRPVNAARHIFQKVVLFIKRLVFGAGPLKLTTWREEKLNRSIEKTELLNLKALHWLHTISTNPSIQRIVARSISVYPKSIQQSGLHFESYDFNFADVKEADVEYYFRGLSMQLRDPNPFLPSVKHLFSGDADILLHQKDCIDIFCGMHEGCHVQILLKVFDNPRPRVPLVIWRRLLSSAREDAMLTARILSHETKPNPFHWNIADEPGNERNGITLLSVEEKVKELHQSRFQYLSRCFCGGELSVDEPVTFGTRYMLFVIIYRNLTSDQPFIANPALRQECLKGLFDKVTTAILNDDGGSFENQILTSEFLNRFSRDILCVDSFWGSSMTNDLRSYVVYQFKSFWKVYKANTGKARSLFATENDQELRFIYRWCSQELANVSKTITLLLFMPKNFRRLGPILRDGPLDEGVTNFRRCLIHLQEISPYGKSKDAGWEYWHIVLNLVHVFKTVSSDPSHLFSPIFYNSSVLVELWLFFYGFSDTPLSNQEFFSLAKSRLDSSGLMKLYKIMLDRTILKGTNRCEKVFGMTGSTKYLRALYKSAYYFGHTLGVPDSEFILSVPTDQTLELGFKDASEMGRAFSCELFKEKRKIFDLLSSRTRFGVKGVRRKSLERKLELV